MHFFERPIIRSLLLMLVGLAILAGCGSYGPRSMDRDQLDYGESIGDNWKNQMLANIVKIRYVDMPVFVDVGSIVSGYTLSTTLRGDIGFNNSFTGGDSQGLGASGTFIDRPTVTYTPKTGNDYLRAILEPVDPKNLLALIQAGYSAELLFTWAVEAINGLHNWSATTRTKNSADPDFFEFVSLMEELQSQGVVGFELVSDPETGESIMLTLSREGISEPIRKKSQRVGELLGLDPHQSSFRVVYAPFRTNPSTINMQTRSVIQMMTAMSGFVDVPVEQSSFATAGYNFSAATTRPFRVSSGPDRPDSSFAEIEYEDYWYWIENSDISSKQVFTLMLFITTLTNQASDRNAPVLTIPTG